MQMQTILVFVLKILFVINVFIKIKRMKYIFNEYNGLLLICYLKIINKIRGKIVFIYGKHI